MNRTRIPQITWNYTNYDLVYLQEINDLVDFLDLVGTLDQRSAAIDLTFTELAARLDFKKGDLSRNELLKRKQQCIVGLKQLIVEALQE